MGTASITWQSPWRELVAWCRRSLTVRTTRRSLEVQQTAAIGNKGTIALVGIGQERVLVGVTNGCVQFHALRPDAELQLPVGGTVR